MATKIHYAFLGIDAPIPETKAHLWQIHSADCLLMTAPTDDKIDPPKADALITSTPDLWVGVKTADCAPVLFIGDGMVGAAHAGWRGALSGVLDNTVLKMGNPADLKVIIGPCIHKNSYEVSKGFETDFLAHAYESERFFHAAPNPDKLLFDLPAYCAWRLACVGVTQIEISPIDTFTDTSFYSYRRGKGEEGRNWSLIKISS